MIFVLQKCRQTLSETFVPSVYKFPVIVWSQSHDKIALHLPGSCEVSLRSVWSVCFIYWTQGVLSYLPSPFKVLFWVRVSPSCSYCPWTCGPPAAATLRWHYQCVPPHPFSIPYSTGRWKRKEAAVDIDICFFKKPCCFLTNKTEGYEGN